MKELLDLKQPLNEVAKIIVEKVTKGAYINTEPEKNEEKTLSV
ncbi:hypothetical protein [Mesobacillus foraminis]|nr:hypothetical protein [Mesobacillus foraminis]